MNPLAAGLASICLLMALVMAWRQRRRHALARRINQDLLASETPLLTGTLPVHFCASLTGAATAEAWARRPLWRRRCSPETPFVAHGHSFCTQLFLVSARCMQLDGSLSRRRFGIEVGTLLHYGQPLPAGFRRYVRWHLDAKGAAPTPSRPFWLLPALAIGLVNHRFPRRAAQLARALASDDTTADALAIVAVAQGLCFPHPGQPTQRARQAWLEAVIDRSGCTLSPTAATITKVAHLCALEPPEAVRALGQHPPLLRTVALALYFCLRHHQSPEQAWGQSGMCPLSSEAELAFLTGAFIGAASGETDRAPVRLRLQPFLRLWSNKLSVLAAGLAIEEEGVS